MTRRERFLLVALCWLVPLSVLLSGFNTWQSRRNADVRDRADVAIRREGAIAGARTFYFVCVDFRSTQLEKVRESHRKYQQTIKLLKLKDTPELRRAAERSYREDLERYSLERCANLPSVKRVKQLYGVDVSRHP